MKDIKMTKYEIDKGIIKDLPPFTEKEMEDVMEDLVSFLKENSRTKHFLLLSNEINYFTVLVKKPLYTAQYSADNIINFLTGNSFMKDLGGLKVFKRTGETMEIWIGETHFRLFDADQMFVEV